MNEENLLLFKLFLAEDIGPVRYFRLLSAFGSAKAVLAAKKSDLTAIEGIGEKTADEIKNALASDKAEKELELAAANKIDVILFNDERYPKALREFGDRPPVLYVKGTLKEKDAASISIVGSRQATNYGKSVTAEFAAWFAEKGITIVSGLARGVDTEAHITAIKVKGRTLAVLGNGLLVTYPPENMILQTKIPESGALISEFPLFRQPDKVTFPRRNRIIAAISKAALVTEASESSGALITARMCAEYGKDVFSVPGSIYSIFSKGTNALIKQGAIPIVSPEDMAQHLSYLPFGQNFEAEEEKEKPKKPPTEDEIEQSVLDFIAQHDEGVNLDMIVQELNIDISKVAAIILKLELSNLIRSMPDNVYVKVR